MDLFTGTKVDIPKLRLPQKTGDDTIGHFLIFPLRPQGEKFTTQPQIQDSTVPLTATGQPAYRQLRFRSRPVRFGWTIVPMGTRPDHENFTVRFADEDDVTKYSELPFNGTITSVTNDPPRFSGSLSKPSHNCPSRRSR